jgi:RIO-like serine/threonine protein kinase
MELIRENKEKHRATYFCGDRYRKVWTNTTPKWISDHVQLLKEQVPNYVLDFGNNWIDYKIIEGTPASKFPQTPEFIERIYDFCLDNVTEILPYVHGDWTLSNMIIDGDKITMCDWDNLGIYPMDEVYDKLHRDLLSSFGDPFLKYME